jgi:phage protein D/phage baseplate assembly protein gpV
VANQQFTNDLLVEVEGSPLRRDVAVLMTHAWVDDSRLLPDMFVLRFRDPGRDVLERAGLRIGAGVRLRAQPGDAPAPLPLLSGEITALSVEIDGGGTVTEVRGYDHSHRLFRGRRVAAYADMAVGDVVRAVAARAHLDVGTIDVAGTPPTEGGITQDNLSDGEFLQRLADVTGAELSVSDGRLSFRAPTTPGAAPDSATRARRSPLVLEAGANLHHVRASVSSAEQVGHVEVRGWDYLNKQAVSATADTRSACAALGEHSPAALASTFDGDTLLATDVPYRTHADARTAADALAAEIGSAFAEIEGVARGNPALRAGTPVALAAVGSAFEGKYTLTSTRHVFSEDGYTTSFTVSGRAERSLYGLTGGGATPGRPPVGGLAPALVIDVRDPRGLGRVKVSFPWLSDRYASGWARTVQLGAGADRGAMILPEVGDEVLVGFEQGDLASPYVLGGLYNGRDLPADSSWDTVDRTSGEVGGRRIVSRTGHRIELVETATADDGVRLATGDGRHHIELDQRGTRITVHGDGSVRVEGAQGVTVDAGAGALELTGATVSIKATSTARIEGAAVSVTGTTSTELSASGTTTVSGALVRIN